jgi:cytochrome c oxidase cbb3-type subunit 3
MSSVLPSEAPPVLEQSAAAPRAKEPKATAEVLDHEYDGIKEYDNPLPGWWVWSFWASVAFAIGYLFHYWAGTGVSVADNYSSEMASARAAQARQALGEKVSEDGLAKLMKDPAMMQDAKALFGQRCMPCHGEHGQGIIGPNLTDAHWIHGKGQLLDIYQTVSDGVADKGMPAWKMQLTPVQLRELAAFVGSLRGKNLPGKPPEGTSVPEGP